jgi:lysophospholipase L1-like esterase
MKLTILFILSAFPLIAQNTLPSALKVDTQYAKIQCYSNEALNTLSNHFDNVSKDKLVIIHYGGSHIQAEYPTTVARRNFTEKYGDGGRGLIFSYSAANTYSSINYTSTHKGKWKYSKSFQSRNKQLPIGVCGMVVESIDSNGSLHFKFKKKIEKQKFKIHVFFENDSISNDMNLLIDSVLISKESHQLTYFPYGASFNYDQPMTTIDLKIQKKSSGSRFRFYGISIEKEENSGVVYHSTGVGAAPFKSLLILDKLEDQAKILQPDIVLLDFGTNDILYTNKIDAKLESQVLKAIQKFRAINPNMLIVLTSTQDLFYKGNPITAGIEFRDLMDSIARKNNCLFWNWYDISGGLNTIRDWIQEGYAQKDHIHLTKKGYEVKGQLLYESFVNTLDQFKKNQSIKELTVKGKIYPITTTINKTEEPKSEDSQCENK